MSTAAEYGAALGTSSGEAAGFPEKRKRAEKVARQLEQEIIDRGWPVGEVLGSETDLINRLGVSRGVLRESIRLLEHHDVATMRQGPGGGLVVRAPNPAAVAYGAALALRYLGATTRDLFEARSALELKCVELAANRIDEEGVAELRAICAAERRLETGEGGLGGTHSLHRAIVRASGNPAFIVFLDVLTSLTTQAIVAGSASPEIAAQVRAAHDKIAEAVIARDGALARHRMQTHLEAMNAWLESQNR